MSGTTDIEWTDRVWLSAAMHVVPGYEAARPGAPVRIRLRSKKGGDPSEWPADLRVRELPR